MYYYKIEDDNYILAIGKSAGKGNITEAEYNKIYSVIASCEKAPDGYTYKLKKDLTWELVEATIVIEDEEK